MDATTCVNHTEGVRPSCHSEKSTLGISRSEQFYLESVVVALTIITSLKTDLLPFEKEACD
jgi:hypothetical protein